MSIEGNRSGIAVTQPGANPSVKTLIQDVNAPGIQLGDNGQLLFFVSSTSTTIPIFEFKDEDGNVVGRLIFYNVAGVVLASLEGASPDASTEGKAQILGGRVNRDKYAYAEVSSDGIFTVNLQNGAVLTNSAQRAEIQSKTSDTGNPTTVLALDATPTSAHAAGFGARLYLQADGTFQGAIYGSFTGAGTDADLKVQAEHSVKFVQGTTPNVTGSRGGNAALASLLTELAGAGLITDGSSA